MHTGIKYLNETHMYIVDKFNFPYIGMQNIFQCGGFFNAAFMLNPAEYENIMHSKHISLKINFYKN